MTYSDQKNNDLHRKSTEKYILAASQRFGTIQALGLEGPKRAGQKDTGTEGAGEE